MGIRRSTRDLVLIVAACVVAVTWGCLVAGAGKPAAMPEGSLVHRAIPGSGSSQSAAAITAGFYTTDTLDDAVVGQDGTLALEWLGTGRDGKKARGVRLLFFATSANNTTGSCRVWVVHKGKSAETPADFLEVQYLGSAALTMGTTTGISTTSMVTSSERFADTIVWTVSNAGTSPSGPGADLEAAFGSSGSRAYSPADNTIAALYLPDVGNADALVFEFINTNTTGLNALVEVIGS